MNFKMHIVNSILLLTTLWSLADNAKVTNPEIACSQSELKEMDKASARIVSFTKTQRAFPQTKALLTPFCAETKKDNTQIDNIIKKCLKGQAKSFGTVLIYSVGATLKTYCNPKNKKKQADLVDISKCVNDAKNKPMLQRVLADYIKILGHGAVAKPAKNRIGYACCHYFKVLNDIEKGLQGKCTDKQIKTTIELVRNLLQSLIDVACGDFTDASDACDKLPPPPAKSLNAVYPNATAFVVPLIELFANLDK